MRIKLTVCYDGTDYVGWQRQPKGRSVQGELERAMKRLGYAVSVQGAGRTDAGVHALGQVATFDAKLQLPIEKLAYALNNILPPDVRVLAAEEAEPDFHARFSPSRKEYRYFIVPGDVCDPQVLRYAWCGPKMTEWEQAQAAVQMLAGEHNFRSFCAKSAVVKSYVRTLYDAELKLAAPDEVPEVLYRRAEQGGVLMLRFCGNGFIYKMVRLMVGALVKVGDGKLSVEEFARYLEQPCEQPPAPAAVARGLYLWSLNYLQNYREKS